MNDAFTIFVSADLEYYANGSLNRSKVVVFRRPGYKDAGAVAKLRCAFQSFIKGMLGSADLLNNKIVQEAASTAKAETVTEAVRAEEEVNVDQEVANLRDTFYSFATPEQAEIAMTTFCKAISAGTGLAVVDGKAPLAEVHLAQMSFQELEDAMFRFLFYLNEKSA